MIHQQQKNLSKMSKTNQNFRFSSHSTSFVHNFHAVHRAIAPCIVFSVLETKRVKEARYVKEFRP